MPSRRLCIVVGTAATLLLAADVVVRVTGRVKDYRDPTTYTPTDQAAIDFAIRSARARFDATEHCTPRAHELRFNEGVDRAMALGADIGGAEEREALAKMAYLSAINWLCTGRPFSDEPQP